MTMIRWGFNTGITFSTPYPDQSGADRGFHRVPACTLLVKVGYRNPTPRRCEIEGFALVSDRIASSQPLLRWLSPGLQNRESTIRSSRLLWYQLQQRELRGYAGDAFSFTETMADW